ncbi:SDR family oxidoreductase [Catenulispora sp. NF23]|uniref:SDR family oxidoreductase n=1 Tax=Catenulispora pinistramenti TaxID=2705254 RepID=A0ABS5L2H3_9ACTN|nr:SDR family oxidoreductase [Catenulispora pinistramenti]MBS2531821.1 SDR family oxidoreductase [Catenulispora pinistramenti]MBS2552536.1 SDR family oxidoreductase [Catenulispora pinistramenti]
MERLTIITGGGRGIGRATALRLARDGHDIAFSYLSDDSAAKATADEVRELGRNCVAVKMDTTDEADVDRLFDTAIGELGGLTGLVNNAGVTGPLTRLVDADPADIRRVVDVNVVGYLLCCRRAAKEMAARGGGAIVNVSSGAATLGSPGDYVHYAGAKAAIDSFTVGLSKELGPDGIRVNSVQAGLIRTRIHADMGDAERAERRGALLPLGRAGEPDEVAAAIAWLLSDDASYATGAVLRVAGGL